MTPKLYYAPGACSLASHICLIEGGGQFRLERVDLKTKVTVSGEDFRTITAKGYVPALVLDGGEVLTENVAVLAYIAREIPRLGVLGEFGQIRLLEMLAYLSTEIHKSFEQLFGGTGAEQSARSAANITRRFQYLANRLNTDYLFGSHPSVADFYLFVMMSWGKMFGVQIPAALLAIEKRLLDRPSVQAALRSEGLSAA